MKAECLHGDPSHITNPNWDGTECVTVADLMTRDGAEDLVIAECTQGEEWFSRARSILSPDDFFVPANRAAFESLLHGEKVQWHREPSVTFPSWTMEDKLNDLEHFCLVVKRCADLRRAMLTAVPGATN